MHNTKNIQKTWGTPFWCPTSAPFGSLGALTLKRPTFGALRVRVELNGNPMQSGGPNRERRHSLIGSYLPSQNTLILLNKNLKNYESYTDESTIPSKGRKISLPCENRGVFLSKKFWRSSSRASIPIIELMITDA